MTIGKTVTILLGGACALLAACNQAPPETEENLVRNGVANTLAAQGNVQDVALTKAADNNYSGTASLRRPDGQTIRYNCAVRRNPGTQQFDIRCGQQIDQALLDELKATMRRNLEQQSLNVSELELTKQDEDHVTGFAQVSDVNTGESARLVCTGARRDGGRVEVRCDVPGGPAPAGDAAPPAEEAPEENPAG